MPHFCRYCGKELVNPDARFCPLCGRGLYAADELPEGGSGIAAPLLSIRIPEQGVQDVTLDQPVFSIGRKSDNAIVLPLDYVSGYHGKLSRKQGEWHYEDLASTNGTYINGQLLDAAILHDGDILRIGDIHGNSISLTFRATGAAEAAAPITGTLMIGSPILGNRPSLTLGRDPQADIHLSAPTVSWHHAHIARVAQGHVITDLSSSNGTFVNGQRIERSYLLNPGDSVQVGPFRLVYEASGFQQYETVGGMRLDGMGLSREVSASQGVKRILNDVSISVYPREFIALVGTSGAGKSTLMKALNGFAPAEGDVLINGEDLYRHFDLYRALIGYVPQSDIVHDDLTVAGALHYAAQLRLPSDTTPAEHEARIGEVLNQVEMAGHEDTLIGKLSGGQRKRVSIAVELLAEPRLFFLDEPTSGLDPGLEKKMMYTLRQLADGGRTILLVTHATANINQCDHVCFLAQGRMVYYGPPEDACEFFGVQSGDFADIYAKLDSADPQLASRNAQEWEQRFRQSPYYQRYVAERQKTLPAQRENVEFGETPRGPRVDPLRQFAVLTRRYVELVFRDRLLLAVLLVVMPIIGLLLGLISERNWLVGDPEAAITQRLTADMADGAASAVYSIVSKSQTMLFMVALAAVLLGLFAAAYEIVKERSIYRRERMITLRVWPYLGSKFFVLCAFAFVQAFLLLLALGLRIKLPQQGVFLPAVVEMYISIVLGSVAAISLGLFISVIAPHNGTVIYSVLLVLFFQIIFAGVIFELGGLAEHLSKLTLTRWTMEGLGISANIDHLNSLTRTRFLPDPFDQDVALEVVRPAEGWEAVTVLTETQLVEVEVQPGLMQAVPVDVPRVRYNDMVSVRETLTQSVLVAPEPFEIGNPRGLQLDYSRSLAHLLRGWLVLIFYGGFFAAATLFVLKRKDSM